MFAGHAVHVIFQHVATDNSRIDDSSITGTLFGFAAEPTHASLQLAVFGRDITRCLDWFRGECWLLSFLAEHQYGDIMFEAALYEFL